MKNYKWANDLNVSELLTGEMKEICELIGVESFLLLIDRFNKTPIYFSDRVLLPMKRAYIIKRRGEVEARQLARELEVSERFIYNVFEEASGGVDKRQLDMFGEK